jgi:hypothetical protein
MPAKFQVPLFYNFDDRYWTASVSANAEQVEEIDPIPHYSTVDFAVTFCAGGVATTLTAPDWTGGIKVKDDFSGTYLVQLSSPMLVGTVYTFSMLIDSTELRAALLSPQNQYAFEIHEATSGISTLVPIFFSISRSYTLTGASPTSASGTLVVAATKTVTFPLSLTFPSADGTNGFALTYNSNNVLMWAATGDLTDGDKGDITVSGSAGTWTIDAGAVTLAKMANIDASAGIKVLGRSTANSGVPQVLSTSGTGNVAMTASPTFTGTVTAAAVTATSINGITITAASGFSMLTMDGSINTGSSGGNIDTSNAGGSINTNAGGSISTASGGGSIVTSGNGSIGFGTAANLITLQGTIGSNGKTATLPNVTGTVVVTAVVGTTTTHALFAQASGFPAYRAIATGDLPSISSGLTGILPGASGGTGVANTSKTITLGGNLTTNGVFATTLTATGTTSITLPTTGTIATLAGAETLANKTLTAPILGTPTSGTLTNCTGLPVSGITASTTTAIGVGSINIGNVSDTTIQRVSAGVISVEGVTMLSQTNTLTGITNKTFTAPVLGAATATSINGITIAAGGSGALTMAGSINTGVGGGSITTAGYGATTGGSINLSSNAGGYGGSLDMSASVSNGGGNIDTHSGGGSINTSNGGGDITTNGNGSIGLGTTANRITLVGTTASNGKTATFPNVTGTVVVASVPATTLGSGATTLAVASIVVKLTGDAGGNTIGTITGGISGMSLVIIFVDALVTITDTDTPTANTVNLSAAFTSSANDTLSLVYDGNKWFETARSVN